MERPKPFSEKLKEGGSKASSNIKKITTKENAARMRTFFFVYFSKFANAKHLFRRSTRHFLHYSVISIFLLVLVLGVLTRPEKDGTKKTNPYISYAPSDQVNEVTYVQSVATIASIVDEKMGQQAYDVAAKSSAAPVLAAAGNGFVAKPVLAETRDSGDKPKNDVREYIVKDGDTLSTIATSFDLTTDSLRWANGIDDADSVKPGQKLLIPPTVGVLYTTQEGDTLESIASRYSASVAMIVSQNDLYGEDIKPGMRLMIPDGVGPEAKQPQPQSEPEPASEPDLTPATKTRSGVASYSGSSYNRFPYGWCTYYVASRRNVSWSGNAGQWYGNARAAGYAVGRTPAPGAIIVTGESGWGHVGYVERVNGDGSYVISEMNYAGWGRVSTRSSGQISGVIGFIY